MYGCGQIWTAAESSLELMEVLTFDEGSSKVMYAPQPPGQSSSKLVAIHAHSVSLWEAPVEKGTVNLCFPKSLCFVWGRDSLLMHSEPKCGFAFDSRCHVRAGSPTVGPSSVWFSANHSLQTYRVVCCFDLAGLRMACLSRRHSFISTGPQ
jgi:hypothetical protein